MPRLSSATYTAINEYRKLEYKKLAVEKAEIALNRSFSFVPENEVGDYIAATDNILADVDRSRVRARVPGYSS